MDQIIRILKEKKIKYREDEKLSSYCTFGIGGECDLLVIARSANCISQTIKLANKYGVKWMALGKGSNVLFDDNGYRGIIILVGEEFSNYKVEGTTITASAGISLRDLADVALEHSLEGFEFAGDIPGTLGGAIIMNAGAYGGEMKHVVKEVRMLDKEGNTVVYTNDEMDFSYRDSNAQRKGYIVFEVVIELKKGNKKDISDNRIVFNQRRADKQPLELPSAGSTFKRPEGYYAGKLIQDSGLRGVKFGGAQVSDKHTGFIVNTANAKSSDVKTLIKIIQKRVLEEFGVELQTELKIIEE